MDPTSAVVLGAGRVGGAIVRDLATDPAWRVSVADVSPEALAGFASEPTVTTVAADLSQPDEVRCVVAGADLVIGAVPGFMGFDTARTVIEAGIDMVDISFFEEDPFRLDAAARERGVTVLVDCGVAPGCGNMILGHLTTRLESIDSFVCMVGGLPIVRRWPYEYAAVFSPVDVIEEYTRPARLVEAGEIVVRPALSEIELVDLPGVGTLEAFNSDGLRTLLTTMKVPSMKEKTLRFPGHAERMRMLRETGFFGLDRVEVAGVGIRPLDLTARLLTDAWRLGEGEEDLTVMRIEVSGRRNGERVRVLYDLLDRYDRQGGVTSMARTTGYTCTAVARLMAGGNYQEPGVTAPEMLGAVPGAFDLVMADLARHGVSFTVREETVDGE
jgi:saccharopine dehydrogenase-like NADP-dependent oxidoreductase